MMYKCIYCAQNNDTFKDTIEHIIENHPNEEIKINAIERKEIKTISFKISAELCREQGRTITIDNENRKIHISRRNEVPKDSPLKKIIKIENLSEKEICCSEICSEASVEDFNDKNEVLQELVQMLPDVIQSLGKIGKLEDFVAFTKLVSEEKFPLDNIAFLLLLDVVRWFGLEQTTSLFRYSDECKLFWNTGYKIFKGRFLRFMGGPKHRGQSQDGNEVLGRFLPENAKINFAVPK